MLSAACLLDLVELMTSSGADLVSPNVSEADVKKVFKLITDACEDPPVTVPGGSTAVGRLAAFKTLLTLCRSQHQGAVDASLAESIRLSTENKANKTRSRHDSDSEDLVSVG